MVGLLLLFFFLFDACPSLFGKEAKPELPYKMAPNERIHVFSLASGHLYERFLRIMILSVVKNTQSKVKFWFLKNFLSPSFKVS